MTECCCHPFISHLTSASAQGFGELMNMKHRSPKRDQPSGHSRSPSTKKKGLYLKRFLDSTTGWWQILQQVFTSCHRKMLRSLTAVDGRLTRCRLRVRYLLSCDDVDAPAVPGRPGALLWEEVPVAVTLRTEGSDEVWAVPPLVVAETHDGLGLGCWVYWTGSAQSQHGAECEKHDEQLHGDDDDGWCFTFQNTGSKMSKGLTSVRNRGRAGPSCGPEVIQGCLFIWDSFISLHL